MKKLTFALSLLLAALLLFSCKGADGKTEETKKETDWRNTVESEGSFFVNEKTRLLYAFDTGRITLWDFAGEGAVLQTIEYDTTVADAIERIEKEDFNGDGHRDIRILYYEGEEGTRYRLWLWGERAGKYSECRLYSSIIDPAYNEEDKTVTGLEDMGAFGVLTRVYAFNETLGLDTVSVSIDDPAAIAQNIAAATVGGTAKAAEGTAKVNETECSAYVVSEGDTDIAYIAHTVDSKWYIDTGCRGFYRSIVEKDGAIAMGEYVGKAGACAEMCEKITGEKCEILASIGGYITDTLAGFRYTLKTESGDKVCMVNDTGGVWYFCEDIDADVYTKRSTADGTVVSDTEFYFTLPPEDAVEPEDAIMP